MESGGQPMKFALGNQRVMIHQNDRVGVISRLGVADGEKMRRLNALFAEAFDDTEHYASNMARWQRI
jgi:hypothetical protein